MCFQHWFNAVAKGEIGGADDAGGNAGVTIEAAGAHRRHSGDKLRLSDRPHVLRSAGAVHGVAFFEHRGHDVMAAADIGE